VDGREVNVADRLMYKGLMLEGVPNMAIVFGYTNASWTLKADIVSEFVCRLLNHMRDIGADVVTPVDHEGCKTEQNFINLRSGYVQRADDRIPRQGSKVPWQNLDDYLRDVPAMRYGNLHDGYLRFEGANLRRRKGKARPNLLGALLGA
jgi:monooxygenase